MAARTIFITNAPENLQRIAETNYWESEYAEAGFFYFSVCAGCMPYDSLLGAVALADEHEF